MMSLSDTDDGSENMEQTPAPQVQAGADATAGKGMSPMVARLLAGKSNNPGQSYAQRTLAQDMGGFGYRHSQEDMPTDTDMEDASSKVGATTATFEAQQKAMEQTQLIEQLQMLNAKQQQQIDRMADSPQPASQQVDEDIDFRQKDKDSKAFEMMQQQMAMTNSLIAQLVSSTAASNQIQKEGVELIKKLALSSKAKKTVTEMWTALEDGFPTLGLNADGQGIRDVKKKVSQLRKEYGELFWDKRIKSKLTKKAINEITGEPSSVPKDQRVNFVQRWTSANSPSIVKAAYAEQKPEAEVYGAWLRECHDDPDYATSHSKPAQPDYTVAFETFLSKLTSYRPPQLVKEHKICHPPLFDAKLKWKKGDTFEKNWERVLARQNDAQEILRELSRTECLKKGQTFNDDEEEYLSGIFSELEGKNGIIKNVVSGFPSDVLDYITITADAWPKTEEQWTYAHFAPIVDAYLLSDSYVSRTKANTKTDATVKALQVQIAALSDNGGQRGSRGGGGGRRGNRSGDGGGSKRPGNKAEWAWMDAATYLKRKNGTWHVINGKGVEGANGGCHPENFCEVRECVGHDANNHPTNMPSGTKTVTQWADRYSVFGENFANAPKGAGYKKGGKATLVKVQNVKKSKTSSTGVGYSAEIAVLREQNEKLTTAIKGCSEVCDVQFIDMIAATGGRKALYIRWDNGLWVMIDSGAEVCAMVGTKTQKQLEQLGWMGPVGPKNPKIKFSSISGNGPRYLGDTQGSGAFEGNRIPLHTVSVCAGIPTDTILLGNLFLAETGSQVDWRSQTATIRCPNGGADLVIPFAKHTNTVQPVWCQDLRVEHVKDDARFVGQEDATIDEVNGAMEEVEVDENDSTTGDAAWVTSVPKEERMIRADALFALAALARENADAAEYLRSRSWFMRSDVLPQRVLAICNAGHGADIFGAARDFPVELDRVEAMITSQATSLAISGAKVFHPPTQRKQSKGSVSTKGAEGSARPTFPEFWEELHGANLTFSQQL